MHYRHSQLFSSEDFSVDPIASYGTRTRSNTVTGCRADPHTYEAGTHVALRADRYA